MLAEHMEHMTKKQLEGVLPSRIEIILVDDGSKDKTWDFILDMTKKFPES
jgi:glycosyltransferase involved in cell wall biosynthesis